MRQVLFPIPLLDWPIYGYGFMLFCAFLGCTWLAVRLARREGYPATPIQDLVIWLFVFGLIGARIVYIVRYYNETWTFWQFFAVWDGGLVFYGSIPGALIGYTLAYRFQLRKHNVDHWKMADIVAPCLGLGLCLGRLGCLLNGCCYGNAACESCPAIHFPLASPPQVEMVRRGHDTPAGFLTQSVVVVGANNPETRLPAAVVACLSAGRIAPFSLPRIELLDGRQRLPRGLLYLRELPKVSQVAPSSLAAAGGLKVDDLIILANGEPIFEASDLTAQYRGKRRGAHSLELGVLGTDGAVRTIAPFTPRTIPLHPTQIYESVSGVLLLCLLLSYYPYRRRAGALMVLFMFGYGVHRFLNEMLRTDTEIVAFGMTLSQNISVLVLIAAFVLGLIVRKKSPSLAPTAA